MTVVLFRSGNLVESEIAHALSRRCDLNLVQVEVPVLAEPVQVDQIVQALDSSGCRLLVTANNFGLDRDGAISNALNARGIIHLNWYNDDPAYPRIIHGISFPPAPNRIDFVSDRASVGTLRAAGFRAEFLPLAAEPAFFSPDPAAPLELDASFVGNSYRKQTDFLVSDHAPLIEDHLSFINKLLRAYRADVNFPVEQEIELYYAAVALPDNLPMEKAVYIVRHFVGYLFRKGLVVELANRYPGFRVFGDPLWLQDLPADRVSTNARYYTNLCRIYRSTAINVDINRAVIRDGLTQRVFDCLASGAFVITSHKEVLGEMFTTQGPQQEIAVFHSETELRELIDFYLHHESLRRAIAARGLRRVLSEHTYDHRINVILEAAKAAR